MDENKSMYSFVRYESGVEGGMVRISEMRAFSNHPYHVEKDAAMLELVDSIQTEGVLVPILIRPIEDEQYRFETISSHRRKMAAEIAGLSEVPAIIRDITFENKDGQKVRDSNLAKTFQLEIGKEELLNEFIRQREGAGRGDDELEQYYRQLEEQKRIDAEKAARAARKKNRRRSGPEL